LIVLDANIIVSAIVGKYARRQMSHLVDAGADLAAPAPQFSEALDVLTGKLGATLAEAVAALEQLLQVIRLLEPAAYAMMETSARARLQDRGQRDWPVLAAAMTFDAGVWSNDRDFFGVGIAVWSTRNVHFAATGKSSALPR
jgi:predicted nucleic acid-binding protein